MAVIAVVTIGALSLLGWSSGEGKCPQHCGKLNNVVVCSPRTQECLLGCEKGWYDLQCNHPCPDSCLQGVCDYRHGTCVGDCAEGYYGDRCEDKCSLNCQSGKCRRDGSCACKDGFAGRFCEFTCSPNCQGGICSISETVAPVCSQGCAAGWTGVCCQVPCPGACAKCDAKAICLEPITVSVIREKRGVSHENCFEWDSSNPDLCRCCTATWAGPKCDERCPACQYSYIKGKCLPLCTAGKTGARCQQRCPSNCLPDSRKKILCDKNTQECLHGCIKGNMNITCEDECSPRCSFCEQMTGKCFACAEGYYGENCEHRCSDGCRGGICNKTSGHCECRRYRFGDKCNFACSDQCKTGYCYMPNNGSHVCVGPCSNGFMGIGCTARCPTNCKGCEKTGSCIEYEQTSINKAPGTDYSPYLSAIILVLVLFGFIWLIQKCWNNISTRLLKLRAHVEEFLSRGALSSPRDLEVFNVTENSCDLSWKESENPQAKLINKFVVQKKCLDSSGAWEDIASGISETTLTVQDLQKEKQYIFRVFSQNRYRQSTPVESDKIKAMNRYAQVDQVEMESRSDDRDICDKENPSSIVSESVPSTEITPANSSESQMLPSGNVPKPLPSLPPNQSI